MIARFLYAWVDHRFELLFLFAGEWLDEAVLLVISDKTVMGCRIPVLQKVLAVFSVSCKYVWG